MNAVDQLRLKLRRQFRRAEDLPPGRHRAGELLEEMLDAAWAAAEMIEHHLAHDAPAQPGPQHRAVSTSATLTTPSATR